MTQYLVKFHFFYFFNFSTLPLLVCFQCLIVQSILISYFLWLRCRFVCRDLVNDTWHWNWCTTLPNRTDTFLRSPFRCRWNDADFFRHLDCDDCFVVFSFCQDDLNKCVWKQWKKNVFLKNKIEMLANDFFYIFWFVFIFFQCIYLC